MKPTKSSLLLLEAEKKAPMGVTIERMALHAAPSLSALRSERIYYLSDVNGVLDGTLEDMRTAEDGYEGGMGGWKECDAIPLFVTSWIKDKDPRTAGQIHIYAKQRRGKYHNCHKLGDLKEYWFIQACAWYRWFLQLEAAEKHVQYLPLKASR